MYNFHVGVKVCLRLGVVPNSTPIVEVKSKEKSGSWSYKGARPRQQHGQLSEP